MRRIPLCCLHVAVSPLLLLLLAARDLPAVEPADGGPPPNIVVILADDLGYSDVGFNGCREIPTPNLDALARSGVRFTSGYASHPYCSPSRAGLLTGRHQQRFGHEGNPVQASDGLPLTETLLPAVLQAQGYRTAAIGKWHLGDEQRYWPMARGFDEWFGFSGGGLNYWGVPSPKAPHNVVRRNGAPVPLDELTYLTDDFSRATTDFLERHRDQPMFVYLAYNAPHSPDQATREHLARVEHIEYAGRAVYGAMVAGVDAGVGRILDKLDELGLREQTLIFFYSDNGGRKDHAVNFPFRGHKGMLFEGGIRVPFCVSWPERIAAGQTIDQPITGLDVFPTALAAAGLEPPAKLQLDGTDLLPLLTGQSAALPARTLHWRYATGPDEYGWAIRDARWKLISSVYKGRELLFDLERDPYEQHDLASERPDDVARLTALHQAWHRQMRAPRWLDTHGANVRAEAETVEKAIRAASSGQRSR